MANHWDGWWTANGTRETFLPDQQRTRKETTNNYYQHVFRPRLASQLFVYVTPQDYLNLKLTATYEHSRDNHDYWEHNFIDSSADAVSDQRNSELTDRKRLNLNFEGTDPLRGEERKLWR